MSGKRLNIPPDILNGMLTDYKNNVSPRELSVKYGYTPKQIYDLITRHGWCKLRSENNSRVAEKFRQKLESNYEEQIAKIKSDGRIVALHTLVEIMTDEEARKSDRVNAANGFLRVTGDCSQTNKIEGQIDNNIVNTIPPEEWRQLNQHIIDFIKN